MKKTETSEGGVSLEKIRSRMKKRKIEKDELDKEYIKECWSMNRTYNIFDKMD